MRCIIVLRILCVHCCVCSISATCAMFNSCTYRCSACIVCPSPPLTLPTRLPHPLLHPLAPPFPRPLPPSLPHSLAPPIAPPSVPPHVSSSASLSNPPLPLSLPHPLPHPLPLPQVVFLLVALSIVLLCPLHEMTAHQLLTFSATLTISASYEVALGVVRTGDYFHVKHAQWAIVPVATSGVCLCVCVHVFLQLSCVWHALGGGMGEFLAVCQCEGYAYRQMEFGVLAQFWETLQNCAVRCCVFVLWESVTYGDCLNTQSLNHSLVRKWLCVWCVCVCVYVCKCMHAWASLIWPSFHSTSKLNQGVHH